VESNSVLLFAADLGQALLENGGETARIEKTINKVCGNLGMERSDAFVLPTGIMLSITDSMGKTYSLVRRIDKREINLEMISQLGRFAGSITGSESMEALKERFEEIMVSPVYSLWVSLLFGGAAAFCFTLLFGGGMREGFIAFVVGFLVKLLVSYLEGVKFNRYFNNVIGGFVISLLALASLRLSLSQDPGVIISGAIMLLVPGLIMVNSIRDFIAGDLVSGATRLVESLIIGGAIAVGTGVGLALWVRLYGEVVL